MIENYPLFTIEKSPDFDGRNRRFLAFWLYMKIFSWMFRSKNISLFG